VFTASRGTYGCRRVAAALNRDGIACSVGLVAGLMRELDRRACQPRAYKRTTLAGAQPVTSPDLVCRDFTAERPGTRLVGDITYLRAGEGWLYLATVIDLATRMVVGWQTAGHLRTSLVIDALAMARRHGHAQPGAVFHADRGCGQYTSAQFTAFCDRNQIRTSVGRTGVCWDNAAAESFFATLKTRCTTGTASIPAPAPGSPSPSTSRSSTTGNACTPPSATAPRPKPLPSTSSAPQRDPLPHQDLSKILDTPQWWAYRPSTTHDPDRAAMVRRAARRTVLLTRPGGSTEVQQPSARAGTRCNPQGITTTR
jgi:transposase InsO family protein